MTPRRWSAYRLHRRVNFYETDCAGIVHFSWFFRYMEEAEHAMWREAGLSIAPAGTEIRFLRVAAAFDYIRPLGFEEEFDVHLRVAAIGEKTMRYTCVLTRGGTRIAVGTTTVVCVAARPDAPMKAVPFPPEIAAKFEVAAGPDLVDGAN